MRNWLRLLATLLVLWLGMSVVCAEGIEVQKAEAHFSDGSYQLAADFNINLNSAVEQALSQGVPLYFVSEFTLIRPRWYWLDEEVSQSVNLTKLSYNTLTRQYRITLGSLFQNFANLDAALRVIGHQSAAPIKASRLKGDGGYIDMAAKLLKGDGNYIAGARMRLDVTQLPKPLQVSALTDNDWNLDSDWYRWIVRPDTAARKKSE